MLMVVTMHFLSHTGSLPEAGNGLTERTVAAILIEAFCIVAVNVYVFISGYFLSESGFSLKRLIRLICQVLFYTLLIPVVLAAAGVLAALAFGVVQVYTRVSRSAIAPDVVGLSVGDAQTLARREGLNWQQTDINHDTIPAGTVISQIPEPDTPWKRATACLLRSAWAL